MSHEVQVPGPCAVSPAGGGHSATVWAQRGVAHHLTHLYQQAVHAQTRVLFLPANAELLQFCKIRNATYKLFNYFKI